MAAFAVLVLATDTVLRAAVERTGAFLGICAVYAAAVVAALLVFDTSMGQWSAAVVAAVGVGLLVVSTVLEWQTAARGVLDDPIVGPIRQPDAEGVRRSAPSGVPRDSGKGSRSGGVLVWVTVFLFPILTVLMVALSWVLHLMV